MDSNLLENIDYFAVPNNQAISPVSQRPNGDSNVVATAARQHAETQALWDTALGVDAAGLSDSVSTGPSGASFAQQQRQQHSSTAPTDLDFGSLSGPSPSPYDQPRKASYPTRPAQSAGGGPPQPQSQQQQQQHQQRKREGHERKRARVGVSDAAALESVDYWIHFDDEDGEKGLGGSFEIDFSKRKNEMSRQRRPQNALNPLRTTPGLGTGLYATSSLKLDDFVDDSALDNALSDDEDVLESINLSDHLSKIDSAPPTDVPEREGLYSTPLSWEKPEPGLRMDPLLGGVGGMGSVDMGGGGMGGGMGGEGAFGGLGGGLGGLGGLGGGLFGNGGMGAGAPLLDEAEQRRLLAIAMNTSRTPSGFSSGYNLPLGAAGFGLGFGSGFDFDLESGNFDASSLGQASRAPEKGSASATTTKAGTPSERDDSKSMQPPPRPSLNRSNTASSTATDKGKGKEREREREREREAERERDDKGAKPGDRAAHNDIERKYRTNLKDRISELKDAVPALKSMPDEGGDDGEGQRALKVSKGTVLTKATEYIHYLERRNKAIMKEHQELARRLQAFEQLLNATARQPFLMPNHSRTLFDPRGFC